MSDEIKGKIENLKGRGKQAVGAAIGNKKLEAEGAGERIAGSAEEKIAETKRKASEKLDETIDESEDSPRRGSSSEDEDEDEA
jgi:uncharacterized protein YjbJ (UPF0337 family)